MTPRRAFNEVEAAVRAYANGTTPEHRQRIETALRVVRDLLAPRSRPPAAAPQND